MLELRNRKKLESSHSLQASDIGMPFALFFRSIFFLSCDQLGTNTVSEESKSNRIQSSDTTVFIEQKGFEIYLTLDRNQLFDKKQPTIKGDSIIYSISGIEGVKNIRIEKEGEAAEYLLEQRYVNGVIVGYDDKTFLAEDWNYYYSKWSRNWMRTSGSNIHYYSVFDHMNTMEFEMGDLIKEVESSKLSDKWKEFIYENIQSEETGEIDVFSAPIESHFRIKEIDENDDTIVYLIFKHLN